MERMDQDGKSQNEIYNVSRAFLPEAKMQNEKKKVNKVNHQIIQ
jgi:hypothetical protein